MIVLVYLSVGCTWILFSDRLVYSFGGSRQFRLLLHTLKGWFFVAVTAFLLYYLINKYFKQLGEAHQTLAASEERLNLVLRSVNDGVWDWNLKSGQAYLSPKYYEIAECTPGAVNPDLDYFISLIHPDDRQRVLDVMKAHLGGATEASVVEYRMNTGSGAVKWILGRGKVVERDADGQPLRMLGTIIDISDRKNAEEAMRKYSRRLLDLEEEMRRKLAAELHDEIGRDLTALGLDFAILHDSLPEEIRERLSVRMEDMRGSLESISRMVREVMSELRPPVLDDYGLKAALRWHCDLFEKRSGIAVDLWVDEDFPRLTADCELALFRIAQEALANVAKHADASTVDVSLRRHGDGVIMSIADNGKGDTTNQAFRKKEESGWGLIVMRERAEAVGGRFHIETAPDDGTRITVELGSET